MPVLHSKHILTISANKIWYIQTLSSATFEKFESKFYAKPDMPKQRVKPGDNVPETQEH